MKNKLLSGISIFLIVLTLLIIIITLGVTMMKSSPKRAFMKQVETVYNRVIDRNKKDIDNGLKVYEYTATILVKDDETFSYIGKFNEATNQLNYLCVSNGNKIFEMNKEDITLEYILEYGIVELSNRECKIGE